MKALWASLAVVFTLVFLAWAGARIIKDIHFEQDCSGYLKRAADANTVELAEKNLKIAVEYLERNAMTSGYTSLIYRTPDEDLGFWYQNLNSSLEELRAVKPEATQLERTNVLMKLRETLLDNGKEGTKTTYPSGIGIFPSNTAYALWGCISSIIAAMFWLFFVFNDDKRYY